jgi:NAD+ synthase (glutamine-hydrolysing)
VGIHAKHILFDFRGICWYDIKKGMEDFRVLDFIRIGCAVPPVCVGNVPRNTEDVLQKLRQADAQGCDVVVFPELALTGYTCADLFFQETLLASAVAGIEEIVRESAAYPALTIVVGVPLVIAGQMYNCGAVISGGVLRGIVPKTYLPNYSEFYERRWFSSSMDLPATCVAAGELGLAGNYEVPVGRDLLFRIGDGTLLGVEICEDLWTSMPPSTLMSLNGAEVIVNLSASPETIGRRGNRQDLVKHQSSICGCIYGYASAGCTESTQDMVFSGHSIVAENGTILAENPNQIDTDYLLVCDADLGKIRTGRRQNKSVRDAVSFYRDVEPMRVVSCEMGALRSDGSLYRVEKLPFVPGNSAQRMQRCNEIFNIQVAGLKHRLATLSCSPVVGVSGSPDSALALLVAVEAMRQLGKPASQVHGITMPCCGSSDRAYQNALKLMESLGVTAKEICIRDGASARFRDIGRDPAVHNSTYENAQAAECTQLLMDYAGLVGGIVVGTGDLSEMALGWCTYNGDHTSMYSVNGSIPKTMLRWMLETIGEDPMFISSREVLADILATPVSPELLAPEPSDGISQNTEDAVGPFALHDFFLYHMLRYGFRPEKVYTLACRAFEGEFDGLTIKKWLKVFYHRFFTQQFKRNSMPDGVKVGSVSLNPRGNWRMPSDACGAMWLQETEKL